MTLQDGLAQWGTLTDTFDSILEDGHMLKADIMDAKESLAQFASNLAQLEARYAENDKRAQEASDLLGNHYERLTALAKELGYKGAQDAQNKTGGCTFQ